MVPTRWSDAEILAARSPKIPLDPRRPYAWLVERECQASGHVEDVATIFLTNRECPFRCLMCDLWQHTLDEPVAPGLIPQQIDFALERLPPARHVKLYNSGNFCDPLAIPRADYPAIAARLRHAHTVTIENHPRLCGDDCLRFRDLLAGELEVAIGLETADPETLRRLNKRMTLDDFHRAVDFLRRGGIHVRCFILLRPPLMDETQGIDWAVRSVELAFQAGARCSAIIPTRSGNGILEQLAAAGQFAPPRLASLEAALDRCLERDLGRVFVDLWDVEKLCACPRCGAARRDRLQRMNLSQRREPPVACSCRGPA